MSDQEKEQSLFLRQDLRKTEAQVKCRTNKYPLLEPKPKAGPRVGLVSKRLKHKLTFFIHVLTLWHAELQIFREQEDEDYCIYRPRALLLNCFHFMWVFNSYLPHLFEFIRQRLKLQWNPIVLWNVRGNMNSCEAFCKSVSLQVFHGPLQPQGHRPGHIGLFIHSAEEGQHCVLDRAEGRGRDAGRPKGLAGCTHGCRLSGQNQQVGVGWGFRRTPWSRVGLFKWHLQSFEVPHHGHEGIRGHQLPFLAFNQSSFAFKCFIYSTLHRFCCFFKKKRILAKIWKCLVQSKIPKESLYRGRESIHE